MGLETLRFRIKALWREGLQFLLSIRQMSCQKPLCQTVANVGVKLTTFSSAKKTKNETKPMRDSEST